jgi:capsular polysaccharide transport system permease protein
MEPVLTATDPTNIPAPVGRARPRGRSAAGLRSVTALVLREMSSRYGRTPGGYLWAVLEPVGAIVVLAVVFSILVRSPPLGNSFILFFASGFLPYVLYANIQASVQSAIQFSKPLLMYPAVSWIDAILARFLLNFLTGLVVMVVVFFGVLQFTSASAILAFSPMVIACLLAAMTGFGIGCLNCVLTGLFPAYEQLWGIVTRPMFLIAGVLFTYEVVPEAAQNILWYTPWIHITGLFRMGVYPTYGPDYISIPLVLIWAMVPMALGLILLRRHYQDILLR